MNDNGLDDWIKTSAIIRDFLDECGVPSSDHNAKAIIARLAQAGYLITPAASIDPAATVSSPKVPSDTESPTL